MRIFILIDCYLPSFKSGPKQIHDLGREFSRQGHEVTILTTSHEIAEDFQVTVENELRIARVKTRQIKGASRVLRGFNEVRLSSLVWKKAGKFLTRHPADLIVFYSPTIFWSSLVRRLKALWQAPTYLILRDIFPQWAVEAGVLRRGLIYRYFRRKEIQQYDCADIIAVQTPGDLHYFSRNFSQEAYRLEVLRNWASQSELDLPQTQFRMAHKLQGKFLFFYGGNLGIAQDVDNILRLASDLESYPEVQFVIVGEGSEVPRMVKLISGKSLRNVLLLPPVDQREYLAMLSEIDVGLISLDRRLTSHNIPGKLLGYLFWGIPVLASVNPGNDLFDLVRNGQIGFCVVNGEDDKLRGAALRLIANAELRTQFGKNARLLLEHTFSAESAAQQVLNHVKEFRSPVKGWPSHSGSI